MPSLREIEQTVATLWLNEQARNWLLNGRKKPVPDCLKDAPAEVLQCVDRKGVALYGGMISYGHRDVMESIYPYCSKLLGKKWDSVVPDYSLKCPPTHYNFNRLCSRLSEYFTLYGQEHLKRFPFLAELADYEWIELEKLEEDTDIPQFAHKPLATPTDITTLTPVRNPTLTVREYSYNIIDIADALEETGKLPRKLQPEPTLVAVFRHPTSHRCKMVEIGAAAAKIVEIAAHPTTYQELIPVVVSLTPELHPQDAVAQFLDLVEELQELGVFVGSKTKE